MNWKLRLLGRDALIAIAQMLVCPLGALYLHFLGQRFQAILAPLLQSPDPGSTAFVQCFELMFEAVQFILWVMAINNFFQGLPRFIHHQIDVNADEKAGV